MSASNRAVSPLSGAGPKDTAWVRLKAIVRRGVLFDYGTSAGRHVRFVPVSISFANSNRPTIGAGVANGSADRQSWANTLLAVLPP